MWVSFDTTVYAYLYVHMGHIYFWVALIHGSIYMEVFSMQPRAQIFISAYIIVGFGRNETLVLVQ